MKQITEALGHKTPRLLLHMVKAAENNRVSWEYKEVKCPRGDDRWKCLTVGRTTHLHFCPGRLWGCSRGLGSHPEIPSITDQQAQGTASPAGGLTRRANSVSKKARPPPLSPIVPSWKCFHIWSSLTWIYPSDLTLEDTSSRKPFLTVSPTPTHQVCPPTFPLQPIPLLWTETFFLNTCLRYWPVRFKRTAGSHPVCFQQPQCLGTHPGSSERRKRDCRGGFLSSFSSRLYRH